MKHICPECDQVIPTEVFEGAYLFVSHMQRSGADCPASGEEVPEAADDADQETKPTDSWVADQYDAARDREWDT